MVCFGTERGRGARDGLPPLVLRVKHPDRSIAVFPGALISAGLRFGRVFMSIDYAARGWVYVTASRPEVLVVWANDYIVFLEALALGFGYFPSLRFVALVLGAHLGIPYFYDDAIIGSDCHCGQNIGSDGRKLVGVVLLVEHRVLQFIGEDMKWSGSEAREGRRFGLWGGVLVYLYLSFFKGQIRDMATQPPSCLRQI